jgi:hypothetical protein
MIPEFVNRPTAMKKWMIVSVESQAFWPINETSIEFNGRTLILRPPNGDTSADIRTAYLHPGQLQNALETIFRFLSAVSWWDDRPVFAERRSSCSTSELRLGKTPTNPILCDNFSYPEIGVLDDKSRLALALYREARSVRSIPYEFLGYFKIINIRYDNRTSQEDWINKTTPVLADEDAKNRLRELAYKPNIGHYMFVSGRCAIAHASHNPVVCPDKPEDLFRLSSDMPVARALAEYIIRNELGIPRFRD